MDQVYVLNRLKREKAGGFIPDVFKASGVRTLWRSFAEISADKGSTELAGKEIRDSDSLFLILDRGITGDFQARQWFYWASGFAYGRAIWVLQNYADLKEIVVPFYGFQHHVVYCETPAWAEYLSSAVRDRLSLASASPLLAGIRSTAVEGVLDGYFNPSTGFPLVDGSASRPVRFFTSCLLNKTPYVLHMPEEMKITRCLDCHRFYVLEPARKASSLPAGA